MKCPQCSAALSPMKYEGVNVHTCNKCGGEFVGPKEIQCIVKTREMVFGDHLHDLFNAHQPAFGAPAGEVNRDLDCPACKGPMRLISYAGDSGIAVDRCDSCGGLWLDHEELEKVQGIMEAWQDRAPGQLMSIANELEMARRKAAENSTAKFCGSRFSFVNALINRLLEAA